MSSAIKILPYYTYEDYCKWEGRWEIIGGIPYAMSPAPSPRHQWVSSNIKYQLKDAIKKAACKNCKVYDFIDIKVADDTVIQPDAIVVCKEIMKGYLDFPAALVVEVLSPSTAMKDRNNKFYIYQSQKIPYYIIVDVDKNEIEIYHLDEEGKYQLDKTAPSGYYTFVMESGCEANVLMTDIWQ
ncbi:Uma2 family endonuclease [soil metagenome]